jgi:RNA polymerase sigma factor (sigma-70 family)
MAYMSIRADMPAADRSAWLSECFERVRAGDQAALRTVVQELNPLLWHVARSQGLGRDDAADVVQTAWLELVRSLREIRSAAALTSWLVTTTRREAWKVRTRSRRQVPDSDGVLGELPDTGPEAAEELVASERDRVLWHHFQSLPERCRDLLRIVAHVDRPDYAAVAHALGMPRGSIGPTRGRCLAKLRQSLLDDPSWSRP